MKRLPELFAIIVFAVASAVVLSALGLALPFAFMGAVFLAYIAIQLEQRPQLQPIKIKKDIPNKRQ